MHPLAYDGFRVIRISVTLKKSAKDGKKEKRMANFLQKRVEAIVSGKTNSPYYETIEAIRQYLNGFIKQLKDDNVSIDDISVVMKGRAGRNGNSIGTTMLVP
ncbi:hypothetical protein HYT45_04230 [Candidatus Uhrbacteria bacterium]|nr:hypothetical protein [Candidatus Uhrbacteria bacterium]